ncbi:MAG TPA: FAD-binding oxidoreductase [Rhodanobacter sp.]|nr:FAD-binding oxidoreductase [Rhodanobacter sp.]
MSVESSPSRMRAWQPLADAMRGSLLLPGHPDYEERRRVWNGAIDRRPLAIARCADAEDVSIAVKFAASEHLPLTIRGGGHNVAGLAVRDGALMLDLAALSRVEVDAQARVVRVEGGALWRDVDAATQPHGLATTGGFVSSTGVGGLTLGGGVGWLMRHCGLAIDNLISADVVLADGRCVVASADRHADLFWALRGGAGGIGVVTRFAFRLHEVGEVLAGAVFHPMAAAPALLREFRTFSSTAPEQCTLMLVFTTAPPAPFLPARIHGRRVLALAYCWCGEPAPGERMLAPITAFGEPLGQVGGNMPYAAWQQSFDVHAPAGDHYYWTTSIFDGLDDDLIDALVASAAMAPDPLCEVHVHHLGGAVATMPSDASAFVHRDAPFFINVIGHAQGAEKLTEVREWARALRSLLAPWARDGMQANFAGEVADWQAQTHDAATRARLEDLRRKYDPTGLFAPVRTG